MSTHKFDLDPKDEATWDEFSKLIADNADQKMSVTVKIDDGTRTLSQNAAIHLYAKQLCEALNDAGLDMVQTLELLQSNDLDIEWTPEQVKDRLWRKVQLAMTDKESTADLTKTEVSEVYEHLNRFLGKAGLPTIPFPDRWG